MQHKEAEFGVGDKVKVLQRIKEGDKARTSTFEGVVIALKGAGQNKTFTVRRIGEQRVGIERIFPLFSPFIESVKVLKHGTSGVRKAKLYYLRGKSPREINEIYSKSANKV